MKRSNNYTIQSLLEKEEKKSMHEGYKNLENSIISKRRIVFFIIYRM